jgi:hypothetical protein
VKIAPPQRQASVLKLSKENRLGRLGIVQYAQLSGGSASRSGVVSYRIVGHVPDQRQHRHRRLSALATTEKLTALQLASLIHQIYEHEAENKWAPKPSDPTLTHAEGFFSKRVRPESFTLMNEVRANFLSQSISSNTSIRGFKVDFLTRNSKCTISDSE